MALRARLITSEQLVQMYLNRIAAYDDAGPLLNSFIHINANALEEARARDRDRQRGRAHGPLFGIPVLLKDNIDTADMPTTARPLPASDGRPVLTPGGSSSGSAIAVSANLVAVAIGTETSGTFTGRAFSEPTLIALAYAYEQATKHRLSPASAPPLPSDFVRRP